MLAQHAFGAASRYSKPGSYHTSHIRLPLLGCILISLADSVISSLGVLTYLECTPLLPGLTCLGPAGKLGKGSRRWGVDRGWSPASEGTRVGRRPFPTALTVIWLALSACTGLGTNPVPVGRGALTVFAAASLAEPFTEIADAFESQHPDVDVALNFAGSQQLVQQIVQGASADVFASANRAQMDVVVQEGRIAAAEVQDFAHNRLVVIIPTDNPGHLEDLRDLARPDLKVVVAAPEVPAGAYALAFLDLAVASADLSPEYRVGVLSNVVSHEENVRAVLSKVALAEADAGIVYASDAAGEPRVRMIEIPQSMNPEIMYPIAVLLDAPEAGLALTFVEFVRSTSGAAILLRHGFTPAGE